MGTLLLARHAAAVGTAEGRNVGQRHDPPLSAAGAVTADELAATLRLELASLPYTELRLVTSPPLRCRQTAAAIAAALGITVARLEVDERLREIDYGSWEGLTAEACRRRDPELRAAWEANPAAVRCPGGESGGDVAHRSGPALDAIGAWLEVDRARAAVVVAHNAVNRLYLCRLLGWPPSEYRRRVVQDPGGYNEVSYGAHGAVVRRVNASPALAPNRH